MVMMVASKNHATIPPKRLPSLSLLHKVLYVNYPPYFIAYNYLIDYASIIANTSLGPSAPRGSL